MAVKTSRYPGHRSRPFSLADLPRAGHTDTTDGEFHGGTSTSGESCIRHRSLKNGHGCRGRRAPSRLVTRTCPTNSVDTSREFGWRQQGKGLGHARHPEWIKSKCKRKISNLKRLAIRPSTGISNLFATISRFHEPSPSETLTIGSVPLRCPLP